MASIRAVGNAVTTTGTTYTTSVAANLPGDHLYLFLAAYGAIADTLGACAEWTVPDGWTLNVDRPITESATVVGRMAVLTQAVEGSSVAGVVLTNPCNATVSQLFFWSMSIQDVGGLPGHDMVVTGPFNTANAPAPAVSVNQEATVAMQEILAVGVISLTHQMTDPYRPSFTRTSSLLHGADSRLYVSEPLNVSVAEQAHTLPVPVLVDTGDPGWYLRIGLALPPAAPVVRLVVEPDLRRLRLGCAEDYRVFVTAGDYSTVIDSIAWSDLEWTRILDEPSTATVTVPDRYGGLSCCARLGGLLPWRFGLRIERDDRLVWSGPVTNVQRAPDSLRVTASDVMARFQKRLATRNTDTTFQMADAGVAFAQVILEAQDGVAAEQWSLQPPEVATGFPFSRTVLVRDFEIAWDILQELAEAAIDFWVGNGVLYVFEPRTGWVYWDTVTETNTLLEGPYTASSELLYGTFTESTFVGLPQWSINGWAQTNIGWVPGADVGETGARRYWAASYPLSVANDGVLDGVETFNLYRPEEEEDIPDDVFQAFADSLVAQRGLAPPIMEGAMLAENAPIDVDHLRPGSIWQVDIWDACYGQLLQATRLKRVTVRAAKTTDGITETVEPVLFPLGTTET